MLPTEGIDLLSKDLGNMGISQMLSHPWALNLEHGLEFIAFGKTLDPFEKVLRCMMGLDDGITAALFAFSRPVRGGYYWCPPIMGDRLDLRFLFD